MTRASTTFRQHGAGTPRAAGAIRRPASPGLRSQEEALLQLQASAGNRAVAQALSGPALVEVQRLVYIGQQGGWRQKTGRSWRTLHGKLTRDRPAVGTMLTDAIPRFFPNKDEMSRWAKGEIDSMGYVTKERTWVKVHPNSFTVIGENHSATTMADLARGLHTSRFLYEPYTENVAAATNPALHAAVARRRGMKNTEIGRAAGNRAHEAEDLHPKILRGLTGLEESTPARKVRGTPAELRLLGWAILDSARAEPAAGLATYLGNRATLDTLATTLVALPDGTAKQEIDLRWAIFTPFKNEWAAYAQHKIDAVRAAAAPADIAAFDDPAAGWRVATGAHRTLAGAGDYQADPAHEIMRAERARDFSIFQHIKKARADGDLFFGLGELHQNRLARILDAQGIHHTDMVTFMDQQRAQFTPP
ncbi:MAG TPA: hypothetical protein VFW71_10670 [Actinomycetota bacterium]|nr:hypothetical protein [Actinomycetota bacterium]